MEGAGRKGAVAEELESVESNMEDGSDYDSDVDAAPVWAPLSRSEVRKYLLQPMLIGMSAAFGMSIGYALFDWMRSWLAPRSRVQ
mmetsp:Transcript_9815/g.26159  ORF Transcript_9815/g.26159 Transcript_9815/m.26159 type:complete len:85 (+) Transcript_9815:44-298(+)